MLASSAGRHTSNRLLVPSTKHESTYLFCSISKVSWIERLISYRSRLYRKTVRTQESGKDRSLYSEIHVLRQVTTLKSYLQCIELRAHDPNDVSACTQ